LTRGVLALRPETSVMDIRLFATKAVNTKNREDRQTNRQTMYRDYRSENREKNSYKRDIAILANSQKTSYRLRVCLGPSMEKFLLAPRNYGNISATRPASYNVHTGAMLQQQFTYFQTTIAKIKQLSPRGRRDDMPPPMAVRFSADLRPSADESAVRTWLSCRQPACLWLGQTDGQIAVSLNVPGIIKGMIKGTTCNHIKQKTLLNSRVKV